MDIVQNFYDNMAAHYDKLFLDWQATTHEQAAILHRLITAAGFDKTARLLDCACGIGTQAIGLAAMGYEVTASDISTAELEEAKARAAANGVTVGFARGDFCALEETFTEQFDVIICMDNALPHMLTRPGLASAVKSITGRLAPGGILIASIRDYDALLRDKPTYSPPYIHPTDKGKRVSFQTWDWTDEVYKLTQYIIEDEDTLKISKFDCAYRGVTRAELTALLTENGCEAEWKFPGETDFYQPIVIATRQ